MFTLLLAAALVGQAVDDVPVYKLRRSPPLDQAVTSPRDIVTTALADVMSLPEEDRRFVRYVWVPDWVEPANGFAQVGLVANSTFSRSVNIIQPVSLADGRLLRLDLLKFVSREDQVGEVVNLYELLREHDNTFNVKVKLAGGVAFVVPDTNPKPGDRVEMKFRDGSWGEVGLVSISDSKVEVEYKGKNYTPPLTDVRYKGRLLSTPAPTEAPPVPHVEEGFAAAAYLNPDGAALFKATYSSVPIMRLDEWVAFTFSSINGGLYYKLTGIKDNLVDTIKEFAGNDAAQKVARVAAVMRAAQAENKRTGESIVKVAGRLDPELAKSKALLMTSGITGRQRIVAFFFGTGTAPTAGVQLVAVTFDIAEDNVDPNSDPLRNAAVFETYNGGEFILGMPNGLLGYGVFNQDDKIIASVPDNVAHDFRAREVRSNVATTRVFAGVSCANCHDAGLKNWGWQPVQNDLHDTVKGLVKILDDRGRKSSIEALQTLTAQYAASTDDLTAMLNQARIPYQYRANQATNQATTRETAAGLADSYWGYWYDHITPRVAVLDLGQSLNEEKSQLFLLRAIDPAAGKGVESFLQEDGVLARIKDGKHSTGAQWRTILQNVSERTFFKPAEGALK